MRMAVRRGGLVLTAAAVLTVVMVALGLLANGLIANGEGAGSASVPPAAPVPFVVGEAGSAGGADAAARSAAPAAPEADIVAAPQTAAPAAPGMSKIVPPEPGPVPDPGQDTVPPDVAPDRSVIRTARLTLEVKDLPAVSATVRDTVASVGGFVAGEHTVDKSSSFTVRVPSNRLDEVMGRLAAAGTVTERSGQAEDVTDQMVDLQSRLATQRASVARVRALLERANTVGEVVAVESELASREAELESLQRRLASMSGRVALSTLTVSLHPGPVVLPEPGNGFLAGLAAGWRAFVAATGSVLTGLGAVLPFALLLGLVIGGVLLGRRAARRHRAATAALAAVSAGNGKS